MAYPKMGEITDKFVGQPYDLNSVLSPAKVWEKLDAQSEEVRVFTNSLIDLLNSTGEDNWLYTAIVNAILGQITDGSLTDVKLSDVAGQIKERVATHFNKNVECGYAVYSDSIPANSSLTKTIAAGVMAHKSGKLVIRQNIELTSVNNYKNGVFLTVSADGDNNLIVAGAYTTYNNHSAYSRRVNGTITTTTQATLDCGTIGIIIDKAYIEGENIIIIFKNTTAGELSLNCSVDWEVM